MKYVIGTRGSKLALWQAEYVKGRMEEKYPKDEFELRIVKTKGDKIQDRPLGEIGGKGLFVREIEELLLRGEIHIGVHSMKDMPAKAAEGLMFTKAWKREDARDVLILREKKSLRELPEGAVIGTGSKRRKYQLLQLRPDLKIVDIRGNVDTRLKKMEEQKLDGIVLAAAGLKRLGMEEKITCYLEPEEMIPAPAQGILAIEVAKEALELQKMLDAFAEEETVAAAAAERGFLEQIGGDCHVPVGAFCSREAVSDQETEAAEKSLTAGGKKYRLRTVFGSEDGSRMAFAEVFGTEPEKLAEKAAKKIRSQIAGKVWLVGAGYGRAGIAYGKGTGVYKKGRLHYL